MSRSLYGRLQRRHGARVLRRALLDLGFMEGALESGILAAARVAETAGVLPAR
jgi:hypothetical protein